MQLELRDEVRGRWPDIYSHYGFGDQFLRKKPMPCPSCGGKDRFRFCDYEKGLVICNQCMPAPGKDGIEYLMSYTGKTFQELASDIRSMIGSTSTPDHKDPDIDIKKRRSDLTRTWKEAKPIKKGDPVDLYFRGRGINTPVSSDIKYHPSLVYFGDKFERHPAMVCVVRNAKGEKATIHRTYLALDGGKASVEEPKKLMPPAKEWQGGYIRLSDVDSPSIVITEGVETAAKYMMISEVGQAWAAVNANNMMRITPPDGKMVFIAGDNDKSFTGQKAAYTLANKIYKTHKVFVDIPDEHGDWADA